MERVAGIIFLATPNNGSTIPNYIRALKVFRTSDAIAELKQNEPLLLDLSQWFRNHAEDAGWLLQAYYETIKTFGVLVVDQSSADLSIKNVAPVGIDANHIDICKPPIPDVRVKQTIKLLKEALAIVPSRGPSHPTPLQKILAAPKDQLPYIKAELEASVAKNQGDPKIYVALKHLAQIGVPMLIGLTSYAMLKSLGLF